MGKYGQPSPPDYSVPVPIVDVGVVPTRMNQGLVPVRVAVRLVRRVVGVVGVLVMLVVEAPSAVHSLASPPPDILYGHPEPSAAKQMQNAPQKWHLLFFASLNNLRSTGLWLWVSTADDWATPQSTRCLKSK